MASRAQIYPVFLNNAGCSGRCVFCNQSSSAPGAGSAPEAAREFLERILPRRGTGEIAFYGGSFTRLPAPRQERLLVLARQLVDAGRVGGVRLSTRPDALGADVLARLAAAPVSTVELGCQSFDRAVLSACGRSYGADEVAEAVAALRGLGIAVGLQLMPGLPGGSAREALASLEAALALRPDFLRIYPTVVLRGTVLEQLWRSGAYRPWGLSQTVRVGAQMLKCCHAAGVPVIRFGLQETPELRAGALAGPVHPALGQLVRARLWRECLARLVSRHNEQVGVAPSDLSDALGHRAGNRRVFRRLGKAAVAVDREVPRGHFRWRGSIHKVPGLSPAVRSKQV